MAHPRHTELIQDGAQPQTAKLLQLYDLMTNEMTHDCWPCVLKKLHKLAFVNFDRHTQLIQDGAQPQMWEVLQLYDLMTNEMEHKCCPCVFKNLHELAFLVFDRHLRCSGTSRTHRTYTRRRAATNLRAVAVVRFDDERNETQVLTLRAQEIT